MASKGKSKNSEIPVPIFFTKDRLTDEIVKTKALLEILPEDSLGEITKKIVQHLVMTSYDPSHSVEEKDELFISFQKSLNLEDIGGDFGVIYSGICSILRMAIRSQVKLTVFFEDLTLLKFPPPVVEAMAKILAKSRPLLESKICQSSCRFPSLQKFRWRVDVIISSGSLSRIMRPIMLFQLILSNGVVRTFEVSIEQFNQLRYSVAKVLYDMQALERHPIMKIVREFHQRAEEDLSK